MIVPDNLSGCGIYRIVQKDTGRSYVGMSQSIKKRLDNHIKLLQKNKHINGELQRDVNIYGIDSISFELLEEVAWKDRFYVLFERESHWIKQQDNPYNTTCLKSMRIKIEKLTAENEELKNQIRLLTGENNA